MNALVHKEIRLLLPAWIAAMLLATVPALFWLTLGDTMHSGAEMLLFAPFSFGILLLALASFGQELSAGTFSIFLAQPTTRVRLWKIKMSLLVISLLIVLLTFLAGIWSLPRNNHDLSDQGFWSYSATLCLVLVACGIAGGLWTTLLFRQVSAAFWFTILVPAFLATFTWSFWQKQHSETAAFVAVSLILLAYSLAGYFWARWMFLRAQDAAWTGGNISPPSWLGFRPQATTTAVVPKLKPLRALLRKKFQSHHITLLIAALLLLSHLVGIIVRKLEYDPTNPHKAVFEIFGFWWLLWFALPMIIGAMVVAEERKLGTLESQLCLPVKRGWQFVVKFVTALLLGVFLGGVMPAVCEGIANWVGVPGEFPAIKNPEFWVMLSVCCLIATGITLVSVFASTLTRNLLQALGTAVLAGMGLCAFGVVVVQQEHFPTPLWMGPLGISIARPVLIVALIWLGFKNFKSLQVGLKLWLRNAFVVLGVMFLIVAATTLIWNRVWELGMTLEPAHGPAQLTGPVRPRISVEMSGKVFALLPDGRIWLANKSRMMETGERKTYYDKDGKGQRRKIQIHIPVSGNFLAASNWTQLASSFREVVGIAADGTLWNLFRADQTKFVDLTNYLANYSRAPRLERIGTGSDWKTVVSSGNSFVALKHDGSLWTWTPHSQTPVQFGHDSDWTAIFGSHQSQSVAGIKRDGSVWKWGYLQNSPSGYKKDWKQEDPEPVQWYPASGDWQAIDSRDNFDLLLKRDGTLWAGGQLPENIFGEPVRINGPSSRFAASPVQIGTNSEIADIKSAWATLLVLKKDGTVYHNNLNFYERVLFFWGRTWKLSPHADWIAIQHQDWTAADLALAADGTLSA